MPQAKLLFGKTSDWFYATGLRVSDPRVWLQTESGETHAIITALEIGEVQHNTRVDKWHIVSDLGKSWSDAIATLCDRVGLKEARIAGSFPTNLYLRLTEEGLLLTPTNSLLFPQRMVKTPQEIGHLRKAQAINESGMALAQTMLAESTIATDNTLMLGGEALTSERVRNAMNAHYVGQGCERFGQGPIVAGGKQGASPHERGHGALKAHELIVIDTFPCAASGYWGDLTRTFLKGTPQAWQVKQYETVLKAQEAALGAIKAGVAGGSLQESTAALFTQKGYATGKGEDGLPYGFFHGLGHSIGLDTHDPCEPLMQQGGIALEANMVITVEPGLYYTDASMIGGSAAQGGGVRIEDVVTVTEDGCDNLTSYPKNQWILP